MKTSDLSDSDKAIICNALGLQRQSLVRARDKEISGSEVFQYRVRQIADVDRLLNVFSS